MIVWKTFHLRFKRMHFTIFINIKTEINAVMWHIFYRLNFLSLQKSLNFHQSNDHVSINTHTLSYSDNVRLTRTQTATYMQISIHKYISALINKTTYTLTNQKRSLNRNVNRYQILVNTELKKKKMMTCYIC